MQLNGSPARAAPQIGCGSTLEDGCYRLISAPDNVVTAAARAPHFDHFSKRLDDGCENIADAALRLNNAWRTWIELQLASQPQDLNVDASIEDILMYSSRLQQALTRKRSLRRFQ